MTWGLSRHVSPASHPDIEPRTKTHRRQAQDICADVWCCWYKTGVFDLGIDRTRDKTYLVMSPRVTPREMAETFTRVTGKPAVHSPESPEEFGELTAPRVGPAFKEDAKQMMEWAAITPRNKVAYGSQDPGVDQSAEELGLTASSFEDWLKRSGWTGPDRE